MIGVFDHPWLGGLFGDAEASRIWSPSSQLGHMVTFEIALTQALGKTGVVTPTVAETVAQQIARFEPDINDLRDGTARDGLPVPALVAQLRDAVGDNAKAVHTGATSQDVIDTALALTLRDFNVILGDRLGAVITALDDMRELYGRASLMGRTRMQAALPITVSDRIDTWSQPLVGHLARLERLGPQVTRLQFGGAVGDRAALAPFADEIAADIAARLGLGNPPKAWHAMRENLADYANLLSVITGTLGKIGQDICLMAQQGIDEIAMQSGGKSSAMPHKQNPIQAELLVTLGRFNATQLSAMHHAMIHEQERSGAAWALEWMVLPQMAQATARSLSATTAIFSRISRIGT